MPKLKSHKGTLKRVKITGKGKVLRHHAGKRHLMSGKTARRRRRLQGQREIKSCDAVRFKRLLISRPG